MVQKKLVYKVFMKPILFIPLKDTAALQYDWALETSSKFFSETASEVCIIKQMLLSKTPHFGEHNVIIVPYFRARETFIRIFGSRFPWLSKHMTSFQIDIFKEFCLQGIVKPGILINIHVYFVANWAKGSIGKNELSLPLEISTLGREWDALTLH